MKKFKNYVSLNSEEIKRQFGNLKEMNPLGNHTKEEVEKEVDFTKAAMAEVKNQVAQYNLPHNHERAIIFNKIETIFGQMKVRPRPPTYWNRTKEEALSYHLHHSRSTAETLKNLVIDLWATVTADKVEKDLQEYRLKKLQYLTKKGEDVKGEERNFEGGRMQGNGDRVGVNYIGSNYTKGDEKSDHADYQFHNDITHQNEGLKIKEEERNEKLNREEFTHPPSYMMTGTNFDLDLD
jgi:hypothetical protein